MTVFFQNLNHSTMALYHGTLIHTNKLVIIGALNILKFGESRGRGRHLNHSSYKPLYDEYKNIHIIYEYKPFITGVCHGTYGEATQKVSWTSEH